jgi:hypothetical protein
MMPRTRVVDVFLYLPWLGAGLAACVTADRDQPATSIASSAFSAGTYSLVCRSSDGPGNSAASQGGVFEVRSGQVVLDTCLSVQAGTAPVVNPPPTARSTFGQWPPGQCRWWDRAFFSGEATLLVFRGSPPDELSTMFAESDAYVTFAVHLETINTTSGPLTVQIVDAGECEGPGAHGLCVCSHALDAQGDPLAASCSTCVASVCAFDPYCCNTFWDGICINELSGCGVD